MKRLALLVLLVASYLPVADDAHAIAIDGSRNIYVTGATRSTNLSTAQALFRAAGGGDDAFVSKLNTDTGLVYTTYLPGSGLDTGFGIATDASGSVWVTGSTTSDDFPTVGSLHPGPSGTDLFVAKLDAQGSALLFGTFFGGEGFDYGYAVGIDGFGAAYVAGRTESQDFPATPGAFQTTLAGTTDGFVLKVGDLRPVFHVRLNKNVYVGNDVVGTLEFRLVNPTANAQAVDVRVWLEIPGLDPISLVNAGADVTGRSGCHRTSVGSLVPSRCSR